MLDTECSMRDVGFLFKPFLELLTTSNTKFFVCLRVKISKNFADFQSNTQIAADKNPKFEKIFYYFCCNDLAQSLPRRSPFFSHQMSRFVQLWKQ